MSEYKLDNLMPESLHTTQVTPTKIMSDMPLLSNQLNFNLKNTPDNFIAGKTRQCFDQWTKLTSDPTVLSWTSGVAIDFFEIKKQLVEPRPIQFNDNDVQRIEAELAKLLKKGVVEPATYTPGQFVSNIFFRDKPDGSIRIILNLKKLNGGVEYQHFKMEALHHAIQRMTQDCFMASIDFKDAYYSVPICKNDRKYLRFLWKGSLYQFTAMPNGLAESPRKFSKLLKIPFSYLRARGHVNYAYIDDSALFGTSFDSCRENVTQTVQLFDALGFTIHPTKSIFQPSQTLTYLGFILDSILMRVSLTEEKMQNIIDACLALLAADQVTIR